MAAVCVSCLIASSQLSTGAAVAVFDPLTVATAAIADFYGGED
jgi:hypothetical protein